METGDPPSEKTGDPPSGWSSRARLTRKDRFASTPVRLADLDRGSRRRAILRCGLTIALCWVIIIGAFYVVPIGHESGLRAFVRLGADVALIGAVFAWQIRRISVAELPELRAIEALGIVVVLFLVAFSGIYLGMSHESPLTFTQPPSTRAASTLGQRRARPDGGALLHHQRVLDGGLRRHHAADRPGPTGGRGPDAARSRHHRCRRSPHLQRGQEPHRSGRGADGRAGALACRSLMPRSEDGIRSGAGRYSQDLALHL